MEKINIAGINQNSITDGPGLRFVIFSQGCVHNCPSCHNPETHPFGKGEDKSCEEIYNTIKKNPMIKGVTFSGGEPFCQPKAFLELAQMLKADGYELCAFTGFLFEELLAKTEQSFEYQLLKEIDILIDGKFEEQEKSLDLKYKGSKNQRTIDVAKSVAMGKAVLSVDSRWV